MAKTAQDFESAIQSHFRRATNQGRSYIEVLSGDLHREIGGYPSPDHRMPVCCEVMYRLMGPSDVLLYAPPKGKGASLRIRYQLPRPS